MQLWPELLYPVRAHTRAAAAMSASSQTIVAALPPSSSTRRLAPAARATAAPVAALPVKLITATSSAAHSRAPTSPPPCSSCTASAGIPASSSSSTTAAELAGACGGALTIVRVPGRERRAELVREQVRRGVERRDGQRDARGRPVGQRGVTHAAAPARDRQQLAADPARLGRADRQGVGDPVDLPAAVLDRLAELEREQRGELGRGAAPPAPRPGQGRSARAAGAAAATAGAASRA